MSMILDAFVGKCVERLFSLIEERAIMMLGVEEDLRRMQRLMIRLQDVLEDAERRRMEDRAINNWLSELRDVMYDADDIFDDCLIEGSQLLLDEHPPSCCNFSLLACFLSAPQRYEIGERISSLHGRLYEIYKDRLQFKLDLQNQKIDVTKVNSRQTAPTKAELGVVGKEIEDATNSLINKLMTGEEARKSAIFAITGMGGIGKTTLASKIFNHRKVQTKFQIKVWVCVSQNYNEIELLKQVIRGAEASCGDANTRAELELLLRSAVNDKSIFLVLDDVWRADVWIDLLRSPLHTAHIDSSVLITSRDENVANQMGSTYSHRVNKLPVETGWEMLSRSLVMLGKREEEIDSLREIGIQIIEKCHGLPLAIKAMTGVLSSKDPVVTEWKKILNNITRSMIKQLPEEISAALYLSYADLPSPLKQCFLYCSLYPENTRIARLEIVRLWVAEGFIKEEGGSTSMEDTAEEYFYELIRRNLLQPDVVLTSNIPYLDKYYCKMHDLFRALGLFISRDESFSGNFIEKSVMPLSLTKLRRWVALNSGGNAEGFLSAMTELKCLRTLFYFLEPTLDFKLLVRFLYLRVLILVDNEIECIPDSIGDLVYLRYLDLSRTHMRQLPESIGRLSNLQFLILNKCKYLSILPRSITQLQKLRCLVLWDTPLISFIPKGIERLKQLNDFRGLVVGDDSTASNEEEHNTLKELRSLSNLRILNIFNLERARSTGTLVLRDLSQLKELNLSCSPPAHCNEQNNTETEILSIEKLFEELVPPKSLETLYINNYFGHSYPKWMMTLSLRSYLPNLSILFLSGNISTPHLPPLGQLPNLRFLCIGGLDAVKRIGPEFLGGGIAASRSEHRTAFPMLQVLSIFHMKNLEEWFFSNEEEDKNDDSQKLVVFPRLDELEISNCPKLSSLPSGLGRTGLKKLEVQKANSLKEVENLIGIEIVGSKNLERISNLHVLKRLKVMNCYALKYMEGLDGLEELNLSQEFMNCLPEWLLMLIEERVRRKEGQDDEDDFLLQLHCNERVLRRCLRGGNYWDFIQQIPRLNAYSTDGEGYLRYVKQQDIYVTNICCLIAETCIRALPSRYLLCLLCRIPVRSCSPAAVELVAAAIDVVAAAVECHRRAKMVVEDETRPPLSSVYRARKKRHVNRGAHDLHITSIRPTTPTIVI